MIPLRIHSEPSRIFTNDCEPSTCREVSVFPRVPSCSVHTFPRFRGFWLTRFPQVCGSPPNSSWSLQTSPSNIREKVNIFLQKVDIFLKKLQWKSFKVTKTCGSSSVAERSQIREKTPPWKVYHRNSLHTNLFEHSNKKFPSDYGWSS